VLREDKELFKAVSRELVSEAMAAGDSWFVGTRGKDTAAGLNNTLDMLKLTAGVIDPPELYPPEYLSTFI